MSAKKKTKTKRRIQWHSHVAHQRRVRMRRTNEDISNDISEGMPVTPEEVLRVLKWERATTQKNQNRINGLRDALVKVGLMLVSVEKYTPRCHEIFKVISDALKHPNAPAEPSRNEDARKTK